MNDESQKFVIGCDVSTSGSKALAMDLAGRVIDYKLVKHNNIAGLPKGHSEIEHDTIRGSLKLAIRELCSSSVLDLKNCVGMAVGGAMHGLTLVNSKGQPFHNIINWDDERDENLGKYLSDVLVLPIAKRFTFSRYLGLLYRFGDALDSTMLMKKCSVFTPASVITYYATGDRYTLPGDGSGMVGYLSDPTQFDLGKYSRINPYFAKALPTLAKFGQKIGSSTQAGQDNFGIPIGTPFAAGCGDQPLGSLGKGCVNPGDVSVELGSSIAVNAIGFKPILNRRGLIECLNSSLGQDLAMCCVTNGCQSYNELVNFVRTIRTAATSGPIFDFLDHEISQTNPDPNGLLYLPFFSSEGSLLMKEGEIGAKISNLLGSNFTIGNIARAAMEAPILILRRAFREITKDQKVNRVILSGGGSKSSVWPQIVANILGEKVQLSECSEAVAFGAALQALYMHQGGESSGESPIEFVNRHARFGKTFEPDLSLTPIYDQLENRLFAACGR